MRHECLLCALLEKASCNSFPFSSRSSGHISTSSGELSQMFVRRVNGVRNWVSTNGASGERNGYQIGGAGECRQTTAGIEVTPFHTAADGSEVELVHIRTLSPCWVRRPIPSTTSIRMIQETSSGLRHFFVSTTFTNQWYPLALKGTSEIPTTMHYSGFNPTGVAAFLRLTGNPFSPQNQGSARS